MSDFDKWWEENKHDKSVIRHMCKIAYHIESEKKGDKHEQGNH